MLISSTDLEDFHIFDPYLLFITQSTSDVHKYVLAILLRFQFFPPIYNM